MVCVNCKQIQGVHRYKVYTDTRCTQIQGVHRYKVYTDTRCTQIQGVHRYNYAMVHAAQYNVHNDNDVTFSFSSLAVVLAVVQALKSLARDVA